MNIDLSLFEKLLDQCEPSQLDVLLRLAHTTEHKLACFHRAGQLVPEFNLKSGLMYGLWFDVIAEPVKQQDWEGLNQLRACWINAVSPEFAKQARSAFNKSVLRVLMENNLPASVYDTALDWQVGDVIDDLHALVTGNVHSLRFAFNKTPDVFVKKLRNRSAEKGAPVFLLAARADNDLFAKAIEAVEMDRSRAGRGKLQDLCSRALASCLSYNEESGARVLATLSDQPLAGLPLAWVETFVQWQQHPVWGDKVKSILLQSTYQVPSATSSYGEPASLFNPHGVGTLVFNLHKAGAPLQHLQSDQGIPMLHAIAKSLSIAERLQFALVALALDPSWMHCQDGQGKSLQQVLVEKAHMDEPGLEGAVWAKLEALLLDFSASPAPSRRPSPRL